MKYYIYKIYKKDQPDFYIGSTNNLSRRKSHHKKNTTNKVGKRYWCTLYQHIRKNGLWDAFTVDIIEAGTSDDFKFVRQREQYYINELKPTLNMQAASVYIHDENENI